jgi:Fic family protein
MNNIYTWQQKNWQNFSYDEESLKNLKEQFLHFSGISIGAQKALSNKEKEEIKILFLSNEAINTSEIEGEFLDRESLQSSIKQYFQLRNPISKNYPRENGMAKMMVDLYLNFKTPLTQEMLFSWHQMIMNGRTDLDSIGEYRSHKEPMQIVSNKMSGIKVHYEAPSSKNVKKEMDKFINWFNNSEKELPSLIRAGIAHAYFELIHPFEDGNGRIGRALIEKSLAQSLKQPTLIAVSQIIQANKKKYYQEISKINTSNEITDWLQYFCKMIITAQEFTTHSIEFSIKKTQFFDKNATKLNDRQIKLIQRIFKENLKEFTGGISVQNYISVTKTSPMTANRDLNDLVSKGIMKRTGQLKSTRYWLQFSLPTDSSTT